MSVTMGGGLGWVTWSVVISASRPPCANSSLAAEYPSSYPLWYPDFLPSLKARFQKRSRLAPSCVDLTAMQKRMISITPANLMKFRKSMEVADGKLGGEFVGNCACTLVAVVEIVGIGSGA